MQRLHITPLVPGFASLLAALLLAPHTTMATATDLKLSCPSVLATQVVTEKHPDWLVYSNDPLRLTGADIAVSGEHDQGWLEPDETKQMPDENLSLVSIFRLAEHRDIERPSLVCHYGVHAQLSRALPSGTTECKVTKHRRFGPNEYQFEASCR